jgi:D-alanyl-D-alanine carboxypeptidase (penicillin-binding protein 5/6)
MIGNWIYLSPLQKKEISVNVDINAKSALVMDMDSGMIVYEKDIRTKRPIASLTKLMTALVVLNQTNIWTETQISKNAYETDGAQMFLLEGEKITVANLLTGLLVRSANDAAVALAEKTAGSVSDFVKLMNRRALYLGLKNTNFANPHGLDDPQNYSTAFDVALLAKAALRSDFIRNTVQIRETVVTDITGEFRHTLKTTNELLFSPFSITGLKTGTTDAAGQCFVGLLQGKNGSEYLIVILGSNNRFTDAKALIWAIQENERGH